MLNEKSHTQDDINKSIYMKCPENTILLSQKAESSCLGLEWEWRLTVREFGGMMEMF